LSRFRLAGLTGASAVATVAIQLVALASLNSSDYGFFSILYLAGAWALSVQLSVVSEAWVRSDRAGISSDWRSYAAATSWLGLLGAVVVSVIAFFLPPLAPLWWVGALSVLSSVYRSGARFHSMRVGDWPGVVRGDLAGMVVAVGAGVAVIVTKGGLAGVMLAWAATSTASAALSRMYRPTAPTALAGWTRRHRASIRPLLLDSLIMDISAIGTPYALAPLLGVANFGIYRGVSNVAAPVRLLLNPLRPQISAIDHARLSRRSTVAFVVTVSLALGAAATGALLVLQHYYPHLGTLTELAEFAVPTGVFVAANMLGTSYYLVARNYASPRGIWLGRLVQTVLSTALPILTALVYGLAGAIWAYAGATLLSAVTWTLVARRAAAPRNEPPMANDALSDMG
jgi:hypothetical protein